MNANMNNKMCVFLLNTDLIRKTQTHQEMGAHRSGLVLSILSQSYKNLRMSKHEILNSLSCFHEFY